VRHHWAVVLAALVAACSSSTADPVAEVADDSPVTFVEQAEAAGLDQVQAELRLPPDCLFNEIAPGPPGCVSERMSGGVAVGDFDGDGLDDLYLTHLDGPDGLYRNVGDGTFEDVTRRAGLARFDLRSNGAGWADLDNDGHQDLVVTTMTEDRFYLFMNDGDGTFTEDAEARGVALATDHQRGGYSVAFGDYDLDGYTDIHFTEWLDPNAHENPSYSHARLLRNRGEDQPGYFDDVTEEAGVSLGTTVVDSTGLSEHVVPVFSFASALVDLDGDTWPDLIVAADYGITQLFWNNGDGTFTEGTEEAGIGSEGNAMGLAIGDVDRDGDLDLFITAIFGRATACQGRPCPEGLTGNRLYINEGDRTFTERQDEAGVVDGAWGWGAAFADVDNDGHLDLTMTNGIDINIDAEFTALHGPYRLTEKRLWLNRGDGTFRDATAASGIDTEEPGTGLAVLDVAGDGALDIVMVHTARRPTLWRNQGESGHGWLRVDVEGSDSNRDAIGAVVEVVVADGDEPQVRHVGINSHFIGQSERTVHVGLGEHDGPVAEVRVTFPATGREVVETEVAPNQTLRVVEPGG
jgi:enediyne biosynthesis protein E4